jgi:ribonuclease HII
VVTAAVILDPAKPIVGLNDSKKLSEKRRLALFDERPTSSTPATRWVCG